MAPEERNLHNRVHYSEEHPLLSEQRTDNGNDEIARELIARAVPTYHPVKQCEQQTADIIPV